MGLTGCMAEELRAHGIRVSVICPGSVATDFSPPGRPQLPAALLQPDDVAHAVVAVVTEGPHSFISEVSLRNHRKNRSVAEADNETPRSSGAISCESLLSSPLALTYDHSVSSISFPFTMEGA